MTTARTATSVPHSTKTRRDPLSNTIWTVGHGNRSFDDVDRILSDRGISSIIDIRLDRNDAGAPDFTGSGIETHAAEAGLGYRWMGRPWADIGDDDLRTIVEQLVAVASVTDAVILCREPRPEPCERSTVLAPALQACGVRVLHILPDGSVRPHEPPLPFDR